MIEKISKRSWVVWCYDREYGGKGIVLLKEFLFEMTPKLKVGRRPSCEELLSIKGRGGSMWTLMILPITWFSINAVTIRMCITVHRRNVKLSSWHHEGFWEFLGFCFLFCENLEKLKESFSVSFGWLYITEHCHSALCSSMCSWSLCLFEISLQYQA